MKRYEVDTQNGLFGDNAMVIMPTQHHRSPPSGLFLPGKKWMRGHGSSSLGHYISEEGLIFHCMPLCNMGLEAVEYSRRWIDEHGDEPGRTR